MAPPANRDDADDLDPAEAADVVAPDEDDFDGFTVEGDEDDELPFAQDADEGADEDYEDVPDLSSTPATGEPEELTPLLEDDDEIAAAVAASGEDDSGEQEDEDVLKEGEFICRSCFMAKRDSALADQDAMLCRDCV